MMFDFDKYGIADLVVAAGENAIGKGFRKPGEVRPAEETFMLLLSELAEALEELRDGRGVFDIYENENKPGKPEGFAVEVADFCIRCFDVLHSVGFIPHGSAAVKNPVVRLAAADTTPAAFLSMLARFAEQATRAASPYEIGARCCAVDHYPILSAVVAAFDYFKSLDTYFDFCGVIRRKMNYNSKRTHKHGRDF